MADIRQKIHRDRSMREEDEAVQEALSMLGDPWHLLMEDNSRSKREEVPGGRRHQRWSISRILPPRGEVSRGSLSVGGKAEPHSCCCHCSH